MSYSASYIVVLMFTHERGIFCGSPREDIVVFFPTFTSVMDMSFWGELVNCWRILSTHKIQTVSYFIIQAIEKLCVKLHPRQMHFKNGNT